MSRAGDAKRALTGAPRRRGIVELAAVFLTAVVLSLLMVGSSAALDGWLPFFSSQVSPVSPISPASPISPFSPISPVSSISLLSPVSPVPIQAGWTMIALPRPEVGPYTASSVIADLEHQGFDPRQIARWENGRWESHVKGFSINDYPIEAGRAYFIRTSTAGTWLARREVGP